ncbi:MAG: hypothetical protein K2I01_05740 [Lachnospiraceae bacterium]|nr:hypothetical protein [Lachnospiraceae bacterium]MDE6128125.1 hypothetical protein [Lachnospiraceae bacterium]
MNRKKMPLVLMLTAGAVTCIITFIMKYPIIWKLVTLLLVLIIFYVLGTILKWALDTFDKQNEKAALDEGEVIAKETEEDKEENSDKENE